MPTLSDDDKYIIELYFSNSIIEIQEGLPKFVLEEILEYYEEQEYYLACAGIKKALDWHDTNTFTKTMIEIDKINENKELN
ncbi:hypothetical protein N9D22_07045 [Flavobacteriaceae bacterium]|nr:hypothetical protein [Flavobacteriaceae bacterium]